MQVGPARGAYGWLVVDALNVIGSRPDGWWRDRQAAVTAFVERVRGYADAAGGRVTVVVDGPAPAGLPEGGHGAVDVAFVPGGPGAADDRIVALLAGRARPDRLPVAVVTADRELQARVRALGADVVGPRSFLRELDSAQ